MIGKNCDMCKPLHYDISRGCINCNCFVQGTLDGVGECNKEVMCLQIVLSSDICRYDVTCMTATDLLVFHQTCQQASLYTYECLLAKTRSVYGPFSTNNFIYYVAAAVFHSNRITDGVTCNVLHIEILLCVPVI